MVFCISSGTITSARRKRSRWSVLKRLYWRGLVSRADIEAAEIEVTLGELLARFEKSGHSRMPIYRETLDEPLGLVHIKDLMSTIIAAGLVPPEPDARGKRHAGPRIDLKRVDLSRKLSATKLLRKI